MCVTCLSHCSSFLNLPNVEFRTSQGAMEHGLQARCFSKWRRLSALAKLYSLALEKKLSEYMYWKALAVMLDKFLAWQNLMNDWSSDESVDNFPIITPPGDRHSFTVREGITHHSYSRTSEFTGFHGPWPTSLL
jgi:hypothetical protein